MEQNSQNSQNSSNLLNKYVLIVLGYDLRKKDSTGRPYPLVFKKDNLRFYTRQEQMDFFDNIDKLTHHITNSDIFKMLVTRSSKGEVVDPRLFVICYMEMDNGEKMFFDEVREIQTGTNEIHQKINNDKSILIHDTASETKIIDMNSFNDKKNK